MPPKGARIQLTIRWKGVHQLAAAYVIACGLMKLGSLPRDSAWNSIDGETTSVSAG